MNIFQNQQIIYDDFYSILFQFNEKAGESFQIMTDLCYRIDIIYAVKNQFIVASIQSKYSEIRLATPVRKKKHGHMMNTGLIKNMNHN